MSGKGLFVKLEDTEVLFLKNYQVGYSGNDLSNFFGDFSGRGLLKLILKADNRHPTKGRFVCKIWDKDTYISHGEHRHSAPNMQPS